MNQKHEEEKLLRPLNRSKIQDLKALAHFIPQDQIPDRIKMHRFQNNSTMNHSFDLSIFVTNSHMIKFRKKKNMRKVLERTDASLNQFENETSRQESSPFRFYNRTNFSFNICQQTRERQRVKEFAGVVIKQKKNWNEKEIERNTECIKTELDRRRTMTQFTKIEKDLTKSNNEFSLKSSEILQKLRQFSKDSYVQQYISCRKNTCISFNLKSSKDYRKVPRIAFLASKYSIKK